MVLPSPQIAIGLLPTNIGIIVTFDIKIDFLEIKSKRKTWIFRNNCINLIKKIN